MKTLIDRLWYLTDGVYAQTVAENEQGRLGHYVRVNRVVDGHRVIVEFGLPAGEPIAAQYHILFHELVHYAADILKTIGLINRQPDEAFVENAAGPLFAFFGCNGLLGGLEPDEVIEWIGQQEKESVDALQESDTRTRGDLVSEFVSAVAVVSKMHARSEWFVAVDALGVSDQALREAIEKLKESSNG